MKTSFLVRISGLTLLVAHILFAITDVMFYVSGQPAEPPVSLAWAIIFGLVIRTFGFMALYIFISRGDGLLGLAGFVLIVFGEFASVARLMLTLGVAEGVLTNTQLAQSVSYAAAQRIFPWFLILGQIIFGMAIYRSKIFQRFAGVLVSLLGVVGYLTGPLVYARPVYSILNLIAWGWLGWELFAGNFPSQVD